MDFYKFKPNKKKDKQLMLIVDRYLGILWDYYLPDRTAVNILKALKYFFSLLKTQFSVMLKVIESDNKAACV